MDHLRCHHDYPERNLVQIQLCFNRGPSAEVKPMDEKKNQRQEQQEQQREQDEERLRDNIMTSLIDDGPGPPKRVRHLKL